MEVRIGDLTFNSAKVPILLLLTEVDKERLAQLGEDHMCYGACPHNDMKNTKKMVAQIEKLNQKGQIQVGNPMSRQEKARQAAEAIQAAKVGLRTDLILLLTRKMNEVPQGAAPYQQGYLHGMRQLLQEIQEMKFDED